MANLVAIVAVAGFIAMLDYLLAFGAACALLWPLRDNRTDADWRRMVNLLGCLLLVTMPVIGWIFS
jgi:hypothetical protein